MEGSYTIYLGESSEGYLAALAGALDEEIAWIIDSGDSRHMMGESGQLHTLCRESSSHAVELGDNNNYVVKGLGSTSLKLESGSNIFLKKILYVLGLKRIYLLLTSKNRRPASTIQRL